MPSLLLAIDISVESFAATFSDSYLEASIALFLIFCFKTVCPLIPLIFLYLTAGLILPPQIAIPVIYLALATEATLGYLIGMKAGRQRVERLIKKSRRARRLYNRTYGVNGNEFMFCFIIRIMPGPPADITSMFFGATGMKYSAFLPSSLLGFSARMIPLVLVGEAAKDPLSPYFIITVTIVIIISVGSIFLQKLPFFANGKDEHEVDRECEKTEEL